MRQNSIVEPNQPKKSSRLLVKIAFFVIVPLLIAGGLVYAVPRYYYDVTDKIRLINYNAPPEISQMADDASMTDKSRQVFYVHKPELNSKELFNENCPLPELTFVLGCYTGSSIYLLDIETAELEPAESVTAAHEMLHAAYDRLPNAERERIDGLLRQEFEASTDKRLIDLIGKYEKHDSQSIPTELHSIIGTEVKKLNPELEEYYSQYFIDRSKVVDDFFSYEQVFVDLEKTLNNLQEGLDSDKAKIKQIEKNLETQLGQIDDINEEMRLLEQSNDISGYNALVPRQNSLVNSYNANIREHRATVKNHNRKVERYNKISVRHNDLLNSVNSKYQEIDGQD